MTAGATFTPAVALELGWSVIPCGPDKRPLLPAWKPFQSRRPTEQEISAWERLNPATWGMVTGAISRRITLDFDGESWRRVLETLNLEPHRRTPSGGFHADFQYPGWHVKTLNSKTDRELQTRYPGLDIRADGGYACIAGHTDRGEYMWLRDPEPYPLEILPEAMREFFGLIHPPVAPIQPTNGKPYTMPANGRVDSERLIRMALDLAGADGRNNCGMWLACQLRDNDYSESEARAAMRNYCGRVPGVNSKGEREPYTEQEALATLREAYSRPAREAWEPRKAISMPVSASAQPAGEPTQRATDRGIVAELSDRIRATDYFAQDAGRRLQRFRGGVYAPDADEHVRRRVLGLLPELGAEKRFSRNLCAEVAEHIRIQAPMLWDRPPMDTLNCINGLLDLTTRELRPHDPAHLSAVQLPVSFDPAATCNAWQLFIETTFPADATALGFEILAWLMVPYLSLQKAILALGSGANGKSIYLSAVTSFIGRANCAAMSLHSLESDRFAAARLMGKLVNVCPDLPSAYLESTSVFKAIVGADRIPAEYKFRDGFDFEPFARLLFSANHPPKSGDSSEGFFRRWVVLPFEKTFSPDRPGYVPRDALLAWLTGATELSGALNRALDALPHVLKGGFTDSESVRQAAEDFRAATDHFSVWLELATVDHPAAWIPMATLAAAYNAACEQSGRPPMNRTSFGRALKRARSEVRDSRRMVEGRQILGYQGIGLKQESGLIQ